MNKKLGEILQLINFRKINEDAEPQSYFWFDAKSVRIYLDTKDPYFDFGVYDYSEYTYDIIERVLHPDILEKEVASMTYEEEIQMLVIYLDYENGGFWEDGED